MALRVFFGGRELEVPTCAGYLDAAGKPFDTGLAIVVLRDGVVQTSMEVQAPPDSGACTPPAEARKALDAAKKMLDELGIDRAAPGTRLPVTVARGKVTTRSTRDQDRRSTWKETWRARDGAQTPLELVASLSDTVVDDTFHKVTASLSWKRRSAEAERTGALKLGPIEWSANSGGGFGWTLHAFASPGGDTIVAFLEQTVSSMRGSWSVTRVLPLDTK